MNSEEIRQFHETLSKAIGETWKQKDPLLDSGESVKRVVREYVHWGGCLWQVQEDGPPPRFILLGKDHFRKSVLELLNDCHGPNAEFVKQVCRPLWTRCYQSSLKLPDKYFSPNGYLKFSSRPSSSYDPWDWFAWLEVRNVIEPWIEFIDHEFRMNDPLFG